MPTAYSTFGDSTGTEGGYLRKYVLAQFRSDADLDWVAGVRRVCVLDELKWEAFKAKRPYLKEQKGLWSSVERGVAQATIVVIDPEPVESNLRRSLEAEGAEEGVDFDRKKLVDGCATALIAGTPVAYLPNEIARILGWYPPELYLSFHDFTPESIRQHVGLGLRDAKVFAARAHATFDVASAWDASATSTDLFRQPAHRLVLCELLSTERIFDEEHPRSAAFLNKAVDVIAERLESVLPISGSIVDRPLVREYDSRAVDHIQAADIAAGWARELLDLADERAVAGRFARVIVNGTLVR